MSWRSYVSLTKPRVVVLLQITALCAVLVHDRMYEQLGIETAETMLIVFVGGYLSACLLYTSPSPRDRTRSRMPSSA